MSSFSSEEKIVLDPVTEAAVQKGLDLAEANPRRWTQDEVREEAVRLGQKWKKDLAKKESA
jgi:hypothetical protein